MVTNCAHCVLWVYNVIHTSIYETSVVQFMFIVNVNAAFSQNWQSCKTLQPLKMVFTAAHKTSQRKVFQYFVVLTLEWSSGN